MLLIVCASECEFLNCKKFFPIEKEFVYTKDFLCCICNVGNKKIAIAHIGVGNKNAYQNTSTLLSYFSVRLLLSVGIAGGLDPKVRLGDIIVSNEVRWFRGGCSVNIQSHQNKLPLEYIQKEIEDMTFLNRRIHLYQGAVLSENQLIMDASRALHAFYQSGCLCVETESRGTIHACKYENVSFRAIKIISDYAGSNALQSMVSYQYRLTAILGKLIYHMCKKIN